MDKFLGLVLPFLWHNVMGLRCYYADNGSYLPTHDPDHFTSENIGMEKVCLGRVGFPYPFCAKAYREEGAVVLYDCFHATRPPTPPDIGVSRVPHGYCVASLGSERIEGNLSSLSWLCLCFTDFCNTREFGTTVNPSERLFYQILLHRPGIFVTLFITAVVIVTLWLLREADKCCIDCCVGRDIRRRRKAAKKWRRPHKRRGSRSVGRRCRTDTELSVVCPPRLSLPGSASTNPDLLRPSPRSSLCPRPSLIPYTHSSPYAPHTSA